LGKEPETLLGEGGRSLGRETVDIDGNFVATCKLPFFRESPRLLPVR
jgi:hypothetical protein